jgi:DNA-binding transcriptional MerR regulator
MVRAQEGTTMGAVLTIGRLAEATGVPARTIRYYEQVGALSPPSRTAAGYRTYTPQAVERLRFLRRARALGLSLRQLRPLAEALENGPAGSLRPRLRGVVRAHLDSVERRAAELDLLRRQLERVLERLAAAEAVDRGNGNRRRTRPRQCRCLEVEESAASR